MLMGATCTRMVGAQAAKARTFAEEVGEHAHLPIIFHDERLTTREAHDLLYRAGHPRQQHKELVDQVAATLILQGYLDARSRERSV